MPSTAELVHLAALLVEDSWAMTPEEFEERLSSFVENADNKIAALRAVFKAAEGRRDTLAAEARTYADAAKAAGNKAERVKALAFHLAEAAEAVGEKLDGCRLQANGGQAPVRYDDDFVPSMLPRELQRVTVEPNTDAIRAALLAGEEVPGAELAPVGRHLRFTP